MTISNSTALKDGSPIPNSSPVTDHVEFATEAGGSVIRGTARSSQSLRTRAVGDDAIEILMNDHQIVKTLFAELADATTVDDRFAILDELKTVLTVHNATEENLVYPSIRLKSGRSTDADTLYHQQDEAKVAIFQIDDMLKHSESPTTLDARIATLQTAVLAHVQKEEGTEFPLLRDALGPKGMAELTEAVREFRDDFGFEGA
jgi:hemerythrin superfamily protein